MRITDETGVEGQSDLHLSLRYYMSGLASTGSAMGLGVQISDLDDLLIWLLNANINFLGLI